MVICYSSKRKLIYYANQYPTFSSLGQPEVQVHMGQTQPSITSLSEELPTVLGLYKDNFRRTGHSLTTEKKAAESPIGRQHRTNSE